jgi:hypothetical protein
MAEMGITVSYKGSLADSQRVEDFEDRVVDLALELGGQARIWRSARDRCPERMVRGVIVDLCPGLETVSLLVSMDDDLGPAGEADAGQESPDQSEAF